LGGTRGTLRLPGGTLRLPVATPGGEEETVSLRLVHGEPYADWDEVYNDNVVRLYRLLYSKVGNRQDAEDLTDEVFLAALRPLRLQASRSEVRGYLAATARTVLAGYWRRRLGNEVTVIEVAAAARFLDPSEPDSDAATRVRAVLDQLPERYRRILELRFLEACSIKEAAKAMGVSVANAKVLQHRALRMAGAPEGGLDQ
jgi:RNA polymerase sigma factor (sigma-70 family)